MKKILLFLIFISGIGLFSQIPNGFNYQAIVRNLDGKV